MFDPTVESLLGAPSPGFGCFSSPDRANPGVDCFSPPDAADLVSSSTELTVIGGLFPLIAFFEFAVGFLSVEPTVGRVGGLLRVVPLVVLTAGADGVLKLEDVESLGFAVELVIVRFGIDPAFGFGAGALNSTVWGSMFSIGSSIIKE